VRVIPASGYYEWKPTPTGKQQAQSRVLLTQRQVFIAPAPLVVQIVRA
jgi:hypothetical protein